MKPLVALGLIGLTLGGAVGVAVHYLSHTVASSYEVGYWAFAGGPTVRSAIPLVHPAWWPTFPVFLALGLLAGLLAVTAGRGITSLRSRRSD